ncbi:uncharacterized protein LOC132066381 [Lycium ferocissimum]|uniref:uncharacterized protein LOC132066381 n=1 Tax=Lycium ferocissimum TaxID=112874 RepID=UPI00281656B9|nr:uncharacterized protein LOC132066381 [Lycium ferocissimum]
MASLEQWIRYLGEDNIRGDVLLHLNTFIKQREGNCIHVAWQLWCSLNTVYILVQERQLLLVFDKNGQLRTVVFNERKGDVKETANIPFYVDPFLRIFTTGKPQEFVRLSSLNLIGALAKFDDPQGPEILNLFLDSQLIAPCLYCMDYGDTRTVKAATHIVMKILMQEAGLNYCCDSPKRVQLLVQVLRRLVDKLSRSLCLRTLKYVVQCYLCLSRKSMLSGVYDELIHNYPPQLSGDTFHILLSVSPSASFFNN